jgi:hypothetical protein
MPRTPLRQRRLAHSARGVKENASTRDAREARRAAAAVRAAAAASAVYVDLFAAAERGRIAPISFERPGLMPSRCRDAAQQSL